MDDRRVSRFPDFFIVGAPRCGTTSMYQYLARHPGIFMPRRKEPHFFSRDLDRGTREDETFFIHDVDDYLEHFRGARAEQLIGEGDVFNLFSPGASARIKEQVPHARILIMLREPVEQMYSFHAVRFGGGIENLPFAEALDAVEERTRGLRLPPRARNIPMYDYPAVARFADQVERYFALFGRERVHVSLLEDLAADPARTYVEVLRFLGVEASMRPDFRPVNENRRVRLRPIAGLLGRTVLSQGAVRAVPRGLRPAARRLVRRTRDWMLPSGERESLDPSLRRRLRREFAPEVARLGGLLGRDLISLWGYDREDG